MLALSTINCEEQAARKNGAATQYSVSNNSGSCTDDICSPFCTCSCCGCAGFNIESTSATLSVKQVAQLKVTHYNSKFSTQLTASIWQPPKIG